MFALIALAALGLGPSPAEVRVVEYLKANVKPGQAIAVAELYNKVFAAPEERQALDRLFNTFFKIPLFAAQHQKVVGRPPSLREISERFEFQVPGEADLLLRIMESDPRIPDFMRRDKVSGEILSVDVAAVLASPRFGRELERTVTGFEGKEAPAFSFRAWDGKVLDSRSLAGRPYLLYFWFSNCPPCLKTAPLLVELSKAYAARGLTIVGLNADRVLELPYDDAQRREYAQKVGISFAMADLTEGVQEAYGSVSVFPTLFVVDRHGIVVQELVSFHERAALEGAIGKALGPE
jgi:thiol-disulfide isomerase/thioredoxin